MATNQRHTITHSIQERGTAGPKVAARIESQYDAMQARLSRAAGREVVYTNTYKANDIKPFLPTLYPEAVRGYEWWGWADLDVVFGDLLGYLARAVPKPACCKGLEVSCNKAARRTRGSVCFNSTRPMRAADGSTKAPAAPINAPMSNVRMAADRVGDTSAGD